MIQRIKNLFKRKQDKYYLIFMDKTPKVHFIEKSNLTEIYNIITEARLPVGSYKIIKGTFVNA